MLTLLLTCGLEDPVVALTVPLGKRLHHPVDLLGLPRQPEAPQELPAGEDRRSQGWGDDLFLCEQSPFPDFVDAERKGRPARLQASPKAAPHTRKLAIPHHSS